MPTFDPSKLRPGKPREHKESYIEERVGDFATKHGIYHRKYKTQNQRGLPDRIFCFTGRTLFIEFKAKGEKPSPQQLIEHKKLRDAGMTVEVVDNIPYGKFIIEDFFDL